MRTIALAARPEPLPIARESTALLINDMQNAFCTKGGYLDRVGFDISGADRVIDQVERVLAAARTAGMTIFHTQNGFSANLRETPESSPWWHKSPALRHMRAHPELAGQILTEGTWDFAFVDRLMPRDGELVIRKIRPSGFAKTSLAAQMTDRGIKTLVVVGIASNVGVEWTLREAQSREYFGVFIEDASMQAGPPEIHRAVSYNVETFIGWVSTVADFETACKALT